MPMLTRKFAYFLALASLIHSTSGASPQIMARSLSANPDLEMKVQGAVNDLRCLSGDELGDKAQELLDEGKILELKTPVQGQVDVGGASNSHFITLSQGNDAGEAWSQAEITTNLRHEIDHHCRAKAADDADPNNTEPKSDPQTDPDNPELEGGTPEEKAASAEANHIAMGQEDAAFICELGTKDDCPQHDAETGAPILDGDGNAVTGPTVSNNSTSSNEDAMGDNKVACQDVYDTFDEMITAAEDAGALSEDDADSLRDSFEDSIPDSCECDGDIEQKGDGEGDGGGGEPTGGVGSGG